MGLGRMPPRWDVGKIAPPLHLVTGALDAKFVRMARILAAGGAATHAVVPGAGHDVALEAPAALAAEITAALGRAPHAARPASGVAHEDGGMP